MLFLRNPCTIFKFWEQAVEVLIDDWIGLGDTTMPLHFLSAVQLRQLLPNCCRNRRSFQYGCCFPTAPCSVGHWFCAMIPWRSSFSPCLCSLSLVFLFVPPAARKPAHNSTRHVAVGLVPSIIFRQFAGVGGRGRGRFLTVKCDVSWRC